MRSPMFVKTMAMLGTMLLISVVLARIGWLVDERKNYQREAVTSVQQSYAGAQILMGPVIQRRCTEAWDTVIETAGERRTVTSSREFVLQSVPATLDVATQTKADARYRGLFKVNGYDARFEFTARWPHLASLQPKLQHTDSRVRCEAPGAWLAIRDARGLRAAHVRLDGQPLEVLPGTGHDRWTDGLRVELPAALPDRGPFELTVGLDLVGSTDLALIPAARSTTWKMAADWPHPSFGGRFLPVSRGVRSDGFDARWAVTALASAAGRVVEETNDKKPGLEAMEALAVAFSEPVNPYTLADRAIKYGLLFVVLTFAAVGLAEVLARHKVRRVHPVQYALVGLVLSLFFLLLLALSEHLPFIAAYALAAGACALLLGHYARHMLGGVRGGRLFGGGIAVLYGLLYLLLLREQTALLVGSLGLFAALAAVMLLTRRLDWYRLGASPASGGA